MLNAENIRPWPLFAIVLTKFQINCEGSIANSLSSIGRSLINRRICGEHERYVHALVDRSEIQVWIYEAEAEFTGPGIDSRFEEQDFDSEIDQIEQLCSALVDAIEKEQHIE